MYRGSLKLYATVLHFTLYFGEGSLAELHWLSSEPRILLSSIPSPGIKDVNSMPEFYMGAREQTSGPLAFTAGILPTESSRQRREKNGL